MTLKTFWPICETCRAMPPAVFTHNPGLSHFVTSLWPSFTSFLDSAMAGCHTCFHFYSSIREPFKTRLSRSSTPIPLYLESVHGAGKATRTVVLAIDPTSLPDRSDWPSAILPDSCYSGQGFTFSPIADVKYTFDDREIPDNSKRFRGKRVRSGVVFGHPLTQSHRTAQSVSSGRGRKGVHQTVAASLSRRTREKLQQSHVATR